MFQDMFHIFTGNQFIMIDRRLITFLFLFFAFSGNTQELIPNVENIGTVFSGAARGFVKFQSNEYLIEKNEKETKVSVMKNGGASLMHTFPIRPMDGRSLSMFDYRFNNSGLQVQGDIFYEAYSYNIYILNFVTGEIIKDIDLCTFDIKLFSDALVFFDDKILFRGESFGERAFYIYDKENDQLERIDWTVGKSIIQAGHWLYSKNDEDSYIKGYNVKSGSVEFEEEVNDTIAKIYSFNNMLVPRLKVITKANEIFEYEFGQLVNSCNCFVDPDIEINDSYFRDGIVYASINIEGVNEVVAKDVNTCNDVMSFENYDGLGTAFFLDNKVLDSRYLMFSNFGGYFSIGQHYIIDIENKEVFNLNLFTDYLYPYQTLIIDNVLFINGVDDRDAYGFVCKSFGINLDDMSSFEVPISPDDDLAAIVIGEERADKDINFITLSFSLKKEMWEYSKSNNTAVLRRDDFDVFNRGVRWVTRLVKVGDKAYYVDELGIYSLYEDKVFRIIEANAFMPLVVNEEIVSGAVLSNGQLYSIEINSFNDSWDTIKIDGFTQIDNRNYSTNYALFHFKNYSKGDGYIDLETREFKALDAPSTLKYSSMLGVSGDNAIIKYFESGMLEYYVFNTRTKNYALLPSSGEKYVKSLSDGKGGFYLLSNGNIPVEDRKIFHFNEIGEKLSETDIQYSVPYYRNDESIVNDQIILPLPGDNEVNVFMVKGDQEIVRSIPYDNTLYYQSIFIKYQKDKALIENRVGDLYQATYFGFDEEPIDLTNGGVSDRILEVVFSNDKVAIFYNDEVEKKLRLEIYDLNTHEQLSSEFYSITKSGSPSIDEFGKLSNTVSLIAHDDGEHGEETFIFDIVTGEFKLLFDQSEGHLDSEPTHFTSIGEYHYFTALSDNRSRQWYRINGNDYSNIEEIDIELPIALYPNPTSDLIKFDSKIYSYEILGMSGIKYLSNSSNTSQDIDVTGLPSGLFYFYGIDYSGNIRLGSFTIQR